MVAVVVVVVDDVDSSTCELTNLAKAKSLLKSCKLPWKLRLCENTVKGCREIERYDESETGSETSTCILPT